MRREELLERVRDAHDTLIGALDGLTEEQATRTGLNVEWSIKDALAHITAWEIEGARTISEIQQGTWQPRKLNKEMIDDFNREASQSRRTRSMTDVRAEFNTAHGKMLRVLQSLPDEVDESSPTYKFAEGVTFKHHDQHAAQIEEWKGRMMNDE